MQIFSASGNAFRSPEEAIEERNILQIAQFFRTNIVGNRISQRQHMSILGQNRTVVIAQLQEFSANGIIGYSHGSAEVVFANNILRLEAVFLGPVWIAFWAPLLLFPLRQVLITISSEALSSPRIIEA